MDETTSTICPWCSAEIPAGASACPKCGALVEGAKAVELPGLTVADPEAAIPSEGPTPSEAAIPSEGPIPSEAPIPSELNPLDLLSAGLEETAAEPSRAEAVAPPSEEVRLEMRKMELEAEIENAGTDVLNPAGEETIAVGAPSEEAIEAYQAGLLDKEGPAGEQDLAENAEPWEDPELEQRLSLWRDESQDKR